MISPRYRKTITYTLSALALLSLFFCSVIFPPFHGYYTTDENFIADAGVLLWYGNTPRGLDWPAAPSMLFYFVIFGIDCFKSLISDLGNVHGLVSVFEVFDEQAYKYLVNREPYILIGRGFQIAAVGLILYQATQIIYKQSHQLLSESARFFLPVLFVTSALVLGTTPVLRPEAISGNLFILFIARLVFANSLSSRDVAVYAGIFGLILAERLIFAFFLPFFIAAVFLLSQENKIKSVLYALLFLLLSFIIFCPFIISDTLVVMKSFVGGIIAKVNDKPMGTYFNMEYIGLYLGQPINWCILVLSGLGLFSLLKTRKPIYLFLIGNLFVFLFLVLRSSKIYDTHVLPAAVINLFLTGLGLSMVVEIGKSWGARLALALVVLIGFLNAREAYDYHWRVNKKVNMNDAFAWIMTLPSGTKMLLNPEFEFYTPKNADCLMREKKQNLDTLKMVKKINFLLGANGDKELAGKDLPVIANSFAFEDERQYDTQYNILLKYAPTEKNKTFDYDVYFDSVDLASHSVQTEKAFQDFKDGKYAYVVTEKKLEGLEPVKVFDQEWGSPYYVYRGEQK